MVDVYPLVHVSSYILFELQLDWRLVILEVIKRLYIMVGFSAFIILMCMAFPPKNLWSVTRDLR
jgi:sulfoxide reductase heme-binding subunit YedZ